MFTLLAVVARAGLARAFMILFAIGLAGLTPGNPHAQEQAPGYRAWTGDFDGMQQRRLIRILVPFSKTIYFIDRGEQLGTAVETGNALADELNKGQKKEIDKIRIVYVPTSRDRLLAALVEGRGDIVAANLTITPSRKEVVDFTDPLATEVKEVLVTGPSAQAIATLDDLGGKTVFVRQSSSYFEHLGVLNARLKASGKAVIDIRPIDENLEDEDLMEMVNAGLLPWCVVDDHKARIWATVFDHVVLHEDIAVAEEGEIAWAIRKDSPRLAATLNAFVKTHKVGTTFGNILKKRYYQNEKVVRSAYERSELEKYRTLLAFFETHATTYDFDMLLLAAQGYQESQLDQSKRSPRGAVGIMQLLPTTAADRSIAISDVDKDANRNIEAGAKYMRYLISTYIDEPGLDPVNRTLLAFAAYNAGPGNLRKIRRATREMGLDPNIWFGNAENGAARIIGRETVQYVGNIYKYYVAYALFTDLEARRAKSAAQPAQ
ncbi:lytic transglycosylase F [Ensifer adhaerens]|uniref:transglycosylase SLT domain-containing protein n=1 Tax=Ensifer adhaerens TaxID=106592 RepID=UPI001F20CEAD|nr:lytic transglycosylase F [Ensifer adhaerens]